MPRGKKDGEGSVVPFEQWFSPDVSPDSPVIAHDLLKGALAVLSQALNGRKVPQMARWAAELVLKGTLYARREAAKVEHRHTISLQQVEAANRNAGLLSASTLEATGIPPESDD